MNKKTKKVKMAKMVVELRGERLWLDVTDIFQFAKRAVSLPLSSKKKVK